jgi:hypothetical protein
MSESSPNTGHAQAHTEGPLPVSQRPESIAFGGMALLVGGTCVSNMVEVADKGLTEATSLGVLSTGVVAIGCGWHALRAHRETLAYKSASEEERNSPNAVDRKRFVRSIRSIGWGGSLVISAELGVIEVVEAVGADSTTEGLTKGGFALVAAYAFKTAASGLKTSLRKQKELKGQAALLEAANPSGRNGGGDDQIVARDE